VTATRNMITREEPDWTGHIDPIVLPLEEAAAAPAGVTRHRRAATTRAERLALRAERPSGGPGRHRREKQSVLVTAGVPVVVASAVVMAGSTGVLSASAASTASGAEASEVSAARAAAAERADRSSPRDGLLGSLTRSLLGTPDRTDKAEKADKAEKKAAPKKAAAPKAKAAPKVRQAAFVKPMRSYRLTAHYGASGNRWSKRHTGLDFAAPTGTPIRAVAAGVVESAGWAGPYGLRTVIRHADGTRTWYAHQSRLIVRHGKVDAGQIIGRVGSTGNSTGPHMHLEVRKNGRAMDPKVWLRNRSVYV
jgi:murein DD-endopeptidase MepM/ murein hydrolase activator NlpD